MTSDAHCHFFSSHFFEVLGRQRGDPQPDPSALATSAGCDAPGTPEHLADRWILELDRHEVARCALIASVPGDEDSVSRAVDRHPTRFVGYFVVDPTRADAPERVGLWLARGCRVVCLFPAMHRFALTDPCVIAVAEVVAAHPGAALFAHCGALSVGIRGRLGLPSPFESRFGDPLDLQLVAQRHPNMPIIVPHFGAGLFRETLMLADLCPNVCVDTSSSNAWMRYHVRLTLRDVFEQALAVLGPRRLLFGTDSSFFPRGWQRTVWDAQRAVVDQLHLPVEATTAIFGGNFDRLFPPRGALA